MSLRLSSLASLSTLVTAASFLLLANCTTAAPIATGGSGGGGSGTTTTTTGTGAGSTTGSTSSSSSSTSSTSSSSGAGGGSNACTLAGGTCGAVVPGFCATGTVGDPTEYSCGGGLGVGCCLPDACAQQCSDVGATRCIAGVLETCAVDPMTNCAPAWGDATPCPSNQTCNSDGTKCVDTGATTCTSDADCNCWCGCGNGQCLCTGGVPSSCQTDADCGPACAGYACVGGMCVQ